MYVAIYSVKPDDITEDIIKIPTNINIKKSFTSNYKVVDLIGLFDEFEPKNSTVGTKDGDCYDSNIRVSKNLSGLKFKQGTKFLSFKDLKSLYPLRYQDDKFKYSIDQSFHNCLFQLHCYEVDGFFFEHTDGQKSQHHIGTILLFPPASISPFKGGDLILQPPFQPKIIVKPSEFTHWTVVAFTLNVLHSCERVISGRRFVFKTELELPKKFNLFFLNEEQNKSVQRINIDDNFDKYMAKIDRYEQRIKKYIKKSKDLVCEHPTDKIQSIISEIESLNGDACIVLDIPNPTEDSNKLAGEQAVLWNNIIEKWPYSSLRTKDVAQDLGDGSGEKPNKLDFDEEFLEEIKESNILYWKSPRTHQLGSLINYRSEYNDSTYDNYNDITIAMICVQKEKYKYN